MSAVAKNRDKLPQTVELRPRPLQMATTPGKPARRGGVPDLADPAENDGATASIRFGVFILLLFVGLTGFWLYTAPLDSAAIAQGIVKVEGNRKTIQHVDGGVVRELNVREGDLVKRGQLLVRLDSVQAQSAVGIFASQ